MVDPIYYKGKFVPFLDEFVSYKGKLFAIAKETLYTGLGDRRKDNEKTEEDNSIMSILRS